MNVKRRTYTYQISWVYPNSKILPAQVNRPMKKEDKIFMTFCAIAFSYFLIGILSS